MRKFSLLFLLAFSLWPLSVGALGIEVNPSSVKLVSNNLGEATTNLTIANPSAEPGLFALTADDYKAWFKFEPSELQLEAGERRTIKVSLKADKSGQYSTWFSAVGYPLDTRAFKAGSGVKIPVNLTVVEIKSYFYAYILGGVGTLSIILGFCLIFFYKKDYPTN